MTCPGCNQEIDPHLRHCPVCGVPLSEASPAVGDASSAAPSGLRVSRAKKIVFAIGSLLCLALVAFINYFATLKTYRVLTAESLGFWIGRCLANFMVPAIVGAIYYKLRRRKRANVHKIFVVSMWAALLAIIAVIGSFRHNPISQERQINERIAALAKEASGQIPTSTDTQPWETAARGFFKDVIQFNKDYTNDSAALDHAALKENLQPVSFRNHQEMEKVESQLRAGLAVDEKYASLDALLQKMRRHLEAAGIPKEEADELMNSVKTPTDEYLAVRQHLHQTERDWMQAAIDVYAFALLHESQFTLRNSKLIFRNGDLSREFNAKMKKATSLRAAFQNERKNFLKMQQEKLAERGLQRSDFVSADDSPPQQKKLESNP